MMHLIDVPDGMDGPVFFILSQVINGLSIVPRWAEGELIGSEINLFMGGESTERVLE